MPAGERSAPRFFRAVSSAWLTAPWRRGCCRCAAGSAGADPPILSRLLLPVPSSQENGSSRLSARQGAGHPSGVCCHASSCTWPRVSHVDAFRQRVRGHCTGVPKLESTSIPKRTALHEGAKLRISSPTFGEPKSGGRWRWCARESNTCKFCWGPPAAR